MRGWVLCVGRARRPDSGLPFASGTLPPALITGVPALLSAGPHVGGAEVSGAGPQGWANPQFQRQVPPLTPPPRVGLTWSTWLGAPHPPRRPRCLCPPPGNTAARRLSHRGAPWEKGQMGDCDSPGAGEESREEAGGPGQSLPQQQVMSPRLRARSGLGTPGQPLSLWGWGWSVHGDSPASPTSSCPCRVSAGSSCAAHALGQPVGP